MTIRLSAVAILLAWGGAANAQIDVPTANYDNYRTSENLNEGILNTNNVNPAQFGKLYSYTVDGQVYAQPLYLHAMNMPGKGTRNVLYVATMHNSVYAFDADAAAGTTALWHVNLGVAIDPNSYSVPGFDPYDDILHEVGILGTPVIDRAGNTIYVVADTIVDGNDTFVLHALDLTDGSEKLNGPVPIAASVSGTGWGGSGDAVDGVLPLIASSHLQRPGLLLANGTVYIGFGSHGDYAPWHGWIVAYNASNLQQTAVFNTTPSAAGSSIWQGGRGLAADTDGSVYCATGNGNYDGVLSWGETVLRLTPALDVADWLTPAEFAQWTDDDQDFGSNGPILIPGTNLVVAGGKAGLVVVTDRTNMGHQVDSDEGVLQAFLAVPNGEFAIFNSALWNRPDGPVYYVWGDDRVLREFQMQNGVFNTTPLATNTAALNVLPFAGMTVTSNNFVPGSGIFWATTLSSTPFPGPGALRAFNALNVSQELWDSDMVADRDALGNFTKFANPTVVNGRVYVPTDSGQVVVYGLLPVAGVQAVVNAASFSSAAVAPGELVTLFGVDIGPSTPANLVVDATGKVTTSLQGYTVTFDGVAAPLLYAAQGQINAVVPFSVAGKSTVQMILTRADTTRFTVTLPVSAAAPAIFALDSSGQGAILNGDYSVNSASRPAARGSAVAIYATGTGALNPAVPDGLVIPSHDMPLSAAPVSVTIGGQAATVSYQGAAPGFVAGAMQINVVVPDSVTPGNAVPVTISAGGIPGLGTVTMAVR
ncbi:MAG TPA: hypothetical protein VMI94_03040 [Bryobacteraceae bacterium]|nr:hypothetical protein [Bryobacteraceae bacterium]